MCALLLSACSLAKYAEPYRIDIRQGNYVTQDMMSQLKPGMSKDQVRFVLGTPLLTDIFHGERWDYIYRFQAGRGDLQQRRFAVFFEDGKLARVAGDVVAAGSIEAPAEPAAPPARVIDIGADGKTPARN